MCVCVCGFRRSEYDEFKTASEEFGKAKFQRDVALINLEKAAVATVEASNAIGILKDEKNQAQKANDKQRIQREIIAKRKERDEAITEQELRCRELKEARLDFDSAETRCEYARRSYRNPWRVRRAGDATDSD